ncbi:ribosomal protein S5 domain 2-type protein [Triangularia setosa]|uniref:Ribosomal protein S5 domain 2-type protein n=1 Tax=Triangularia setosa TaxID=2587417 RepID=A0AAN6WB54_9PEZI|nr:ribosomal protein S5 domain 2-type protein [Podospora setosa]
MSEALLDEISALNSIYGPTTLLPSPSDPDPTIYILTLPPLNPSSSPAPSSSLRVQFPPTYPDVPPVILSTHSSNPSLPRGTAARDLSLFRDAVSAVYNPSQVCLFDAVESFNELLSAITSSSPVRSSRSPSPESAAPPPRPQDQIQSEKEPPWVLSVPFTELKSTFLARIAPVTSVSQAKSYLSHLLSTDKKVRSATHNITAWRIRGENGTSYQDCDDDGETAAGGRLLHLMQVMDLWDVMVVVTRWYGGQKLGPRRFALINMAARDGFVRAGLVAEEGRDQGRKKGK